MSWETKSVMDQKMLFIKMLESGKYTMTSLCKRFNISRTTGYKLRNRYEEEGESCFKEVSRAPHSSPHRTSGEVEEAIVKLRKQYPNWGARKIKVLLATKISEDEIPSETTINAIMKRNNLVFPRRRRHPKEEKLFPKFDPESPNEIWSADYKGSLE